MFGLSFAWVDGGRLFVLGDVPPVEQALDDEIGRSEDRYFDLVGVLGDSQQGLGNHGGEKLQANGVIVVAEELSDLEMLLDPAEQQFDLPAGLVELAHSDR